MHVFDLNPLATSSPLTADQIVTLRDLHEQLQCKHYLITTLNTKILGALDNDEEIKAEILQTEEIESSISTARTQHHLTITLTEVVETRHEDTPPATLPPPASPEHHTRDSVSLTCLPKLDLPQFSSNPFFGKNFGTASRQPYTTHP